MNRCDQFRQGHRNAAKAAVEFLHDRANEMNDPHAKAVLDCAAWDLGVHLKAKAAPTQETDHG